MKTTEQPAPEQEKRSAPATTKSSFALSIGTWLALIISLATVFLTLLGYGHDVAFLNSVGLRPEELQRTPLDFLLRSWRPLADTFLPALNKMSTLDFHLQMLEQSWWKVWWILLLLPALSAAVACAVYYRPSLASRVQQLKGTWFFRKITPTIAAFSNHLLEWWRTPTRRWSLVGWLALPLAFAGLALLLFATWFLLGMGVMSFAAIPAMGFASGKTKAQQEVLAPLGCVGQKLAPGQDINQQARCLRVLRDTQEVARGYLIDYAMGRVFLYQPCTKQPISVSLERTVIEHVNTLGLAGPGKNCRPGQAGSP